jgi:hypothetical protein
VLLQLPSRFGNPRSALAGQRRTSLHQFARRARLTLVDDDCTKKAVAELNRD